MVSILPNPSSIDPHKEITVGDIDKWFGKEIKGKLEVLLADKINVFQKNKEKQKGLADEKELVRPYVNTVTVKLYKDKSYVQNSVMNQYFLGNKSNFDMYSQDFKINSDTSFDQLKRGACEFWGEKNPNEFTFYDSKLNEILIDKIEGTSSIFGSQAKEMTINSFFETFLSTKAILILMKPVLAQDKCIKEQRHSINIRRDKNSGAYLSRISITIL